MRNKKREKQNRIEQNRRTGVTNEKRHEHREWIMKIIKAHRIEMC